MDKEIFFKVKVDSASNLPSSLCKDVFVNYIFKHEPEITHRVPMVEGRTQNPVFNYEKVHRIDAVNNYILDYFKSGSIVLKVYGNPEIGAMPAMQQASPTKAPAAA